MSFQAAAPPENGGGELPVAATGGGETTISADQATFASLQTLKFADDIDDEIEQYEASTTEQQRRRPSVTTSTKHDDSRVVPKKKRDASVPSRSNDTSPTEAATPFHVHLGIFLALLLGITGTILGIISLLNANDDEDGGPSPNSLPDCVGAAEGEICELDGNDGASPLLLDAIVERGYVNCGLSFEQVGFLTQTGVNSETQEPTYAGFDVDLCRAIAAALFDGDSEAYKPVVFPMEDRWTMLNSTKIDVLFRTTRTMQRQVFEPSIGTGMEFSSPYFYDGLGFGGIGEFVECAESGIVNGTCAGLRICVMGPGTHESVVRDLVDVENFVVESTERDYYGAFPSVCNVLAGEQVMISEATVRQMGYEGEYEVGTGLFSREPLCLVTRRGDPLWTGFVEAVRNSLVDAEEQGITQLTAGNLRSSDLFGPRFENLFRHAVGVGGSYRELYNRNLEAYVPRSGLNLLNGGRSPRMWSFPFGDLDVNGPDLEDVSPTIKTIRERGYVDCGTSLFFIFAQFDEATNQYRGPSVSLCKAISAALFHGVERLLTTVAPFQLRANLLQSNRTDLMLTFGRTLEDDVKEGTTGKGFSISNPYFFTGVAFGGEPFFVDCGERLDVFTPECQSLRVCVLSDSSLVTTFSELLRDDYLLPKDTTEEMFKSLRTGQCNTMLTAAVRLHALFAQAGPNSTFVVGPRLFSIVPISLATREDDPVWSAFVDWITMSLIHAEENGIDKASATMMPRTNLFGPLGSDVFYHAVNAVGNYGEIFRPTFQRAVPRVGIYLLNNNTAPLQYSI